MAIRIVGVDLPQNKRGEVGLTYIYGVGRSSAKKILEEANVDINIKVKDWTIKLNDEEYDPEVELLKSVMTLSPHQYRIENEEELNEMRQIAGIQTINAHAKSDSLLKDFLAKAGL